VSRADEVAADRYVIPDAPRLRAAFRLAASDLYFNSWRLVAANLVWGLWLLLCLLLAVYWPLGGLLLGIALAVPTAGIYRLSALVVRQESVAFSDAVETYRARLAPALGVGAIAILGTTVFLVNVVTGLVTLANPVGWAIATAALWGVFILWAWLLCLWPLLVDPRREGLPIRPRMRLAAILVLAFPVRLAALTLVTAVVMGVSTVLFAALLTITVAYCALVGCRYVLPAADRLEGRATVLVLD